MTLIFFYLSGLIYNRNYDDILYVIQNGSLLRIDASFESYDIYDHYCLEWDDEEDILTAVVCEFDDMLFRVDRAQALVFATCMIISVPVRINLDSIDVLTIFGWKGRTKKSRRWREFNQIERVSITLSLI